MNVSQGAAYESKGMEHGVNMFEIAVQGTARLFDLQLAAWRSLLQMQARVVSVLGMPDYSGLLGNGDARVSRLFETGADYVLGMTRQGVQTAGQIRQQLGRVAEQQMVQVTQEMQRGLDELAKRAEQGLQEAKQIGQQQAGEAEAAAHDAQPQAEPKPEQPPVAEPPPPEGAPEDERIRAVR